MSTQPPVNTAESDAFFRQSSFHATTSAKDLPDPMGKLMFNELNPDTMALVPPSDWVFLLVGVAVVVLGYMGASWLDDRGIAQEDLQRAEAMAQGRAEGEAIANQVWAGRVVQAYQQGVADEHGRQSYRAGQGCPVGKPHVAPTM